MADKEGASSSEKTWDKGPPPPGEAGEYAALASDTGAADGSNDDCNRDNTDSSIELKSGVIPVYNDALSKETQLPAPRSCYNNANDDSTEERIVTPTGSLKYGINWEDLNDIDVSQEDPSQLNDSIMQDNMQDVEDRKPNSSELDSIDNSPDQIPDSYAESVSSANVRTTVERPVVATVSETERNGNFSQFMLGSSSRESLSGSCDSNANIKSVDSAGMTRTLSNSHCTTDQDVLVQRCDSNASEHCSPHRTENGNIPPEAPLETPWPRQRLRSESEPASQEHFEKVERGRKSSRINPAISLSVETTNDAMSPPPSPTRSPVITQTRPTSNLTSSPGTMISYIDRKVQEILDTERSYVKDLEDIIQYYQQVMEDNKELELSEEDLNTLFGNLQSVHRFNKELLEELEKCNNDAVEIAECFLEKEREFSVYTDYCTNYPDAVEVLTNCTKNPQIAALFKKCQASLGHALPLGAYLLKPVQRVLKYHLLFQDMHKHCSMNTAGIDVIQDALDCMTYVARHINEMKRKHEAAVRVQEIQSQMLGLEKDLNSYGDLVLEDVFRLQGARAERYLYLFVKVLLIGKRREDGLIYVKTHISCSNLMLIDSIPKEPLGFNVIPFDNPTIQYTILTKNMEQKNLWTHEIKRMILENYGSDIPTKVKELILKTTTPERGQSSSQDGEVGLSRDKKERRSRRKKRRNSEPMNKLIRTVEPTAMTKLQRGQRQVKAALENILTSYPGKSMKRPAILRRQAEMMSAEVLTDDSLDHSEVEHTTSLTDKQQSMEDLSKFRQNSVSNVEPGQPETRSPDKRSLDGTESPRSLDCHSMELDVSFSTLSEEDQGPHPRITRSRGTKESNRDSGIGSMTLSEHLKQDLDDRGSTEGDKADHSVEETTESGNTMIKTCRKMGNSFSEEDNVDEDPEKVQKSLDSPDELEALEVLNERIDPRFIDKCGTIDIDSLRAVIVNEKNMSPKSDEAFKLRYNIKSYKRMSSGSQSSQPDEDNVWIKMTPTRTRGRNPRFSSPRPLSADVATHPHFNKLPLARSSSENFKHLEDINEFNLRTLSDPNILDTHIDKDSDTSSSKDERSAHLLDLSISTLGASDEFSLSSTSSHEENLLESVTSAFKRLGQKYSLQSGLVDKREADSLSGNDSDEGDARQSRRDVSKTKKKANSTERKTGLKEEQYARRTHRSEATINVSNKLSTSKKDAPVPLPKRTVKKLAREYSRRAKSLERPSTLVHEPCVDNKQIRVFNFSIEEDQETDSKPLGMTHHPKGNLAKKVQSLQQDLTQSQQKSSHVKDESTTDLYYATPVLLSDSSNSDEDENTLPMQDDPVVVSRASERKTVRDAVKRFECLSPKRTLEGKVVTPNAGLTVQQRLRTIQETSDCRRSKSVDRSQFDECRSSSYRRTRSPIKSLRERKLELEEWLARPIGSGRYRSEGAFLGMANSDAISKSSYSDERDREVFSARSSHTSSVQSSESASPLPPRKELCRRWSSQSSSLSEEDAVAFKSIKDRFKELEKAAYKPVPRTVKNAREEINAIAQAEKYFQDADGDTEMDSTQRHPDKADFVEENIVLVDPNAAERDFSTIKVLQENEIVRLTESPVSNENQSLCAGSEVENHPESHDITTRAQTEDYAPDAAPSGDGDTLKRSRAEELMRELDMISMSSVETSVTGTLKHLDHTGSFSVQKEQDCADTCMHSQSDASELCALNPADHINCGTCNADTKDIPIEEDPRSTSTQYSLEDDDISIGQSHRMNHNYPGTFSDDACVPMRVTSKVNIDRDTQSEGGLSPERKPLPLERILSCDSNIFMDAKSDLGGSEDSSSQSGFVTPVESFSQD